MENTEQTREQQVWQRVMARQEMPRGDDLRTLLLAAMEQSGSFRRLSEALSGKQRELVKQLYEAQQAGVACLKGIAALSHQGEEALKLWSPAKEPAAKLLEKCYHRSRRCLVEYTARCADPEFGPVFQQLARREEQICAQIAQLLGSLR